MPAEAQPIEFTAEGGEVYSVAFTTNALCSLEEDAGGLSITEIGERLAKGKAGVRGARALFRAALLEGKPEITAVDAGRLMADLGPDETAELIQAAFERLKEGLTAGRRKLPKPDPRGRLTVEAAGLRLVLSFAMNAQAEMEEYFGGLTPDEIFHKLETDGVCLKDVRAMFRAALIDFKEVSSEEAGRIMDKIGIRFASEAIKAAWPAAFPEAEEEGEEGEGEGKPAPNRRDRRAAAAGKGSSPTKRR